MVDFVEIAFVVTFGYSHVVDYAIELALFGAYFRKLFFQSLEVFVVEIDEAYASVSQVSSAARRANAGVSFKAFFQSFFHQKTAYEAGGSGDKNFHNRCYFSTKPGPRFSIMPFDVSSCTALSSTPLMKMLLPEVL